MNFLKFIVKNKVIITLFFTIVTTSFLLFDLIHNDFISYDKEYQEISGVVVDVVETKEDYIWFNGDVVVYDKVTYYTLKIQLEDDSIISLKSQSYYKYNIGDELRIKKVYKIKDDSKEFLEYKIIINN